MHASGTRIATQDNTGVRWNHKDPNLKSFRSTGPNGSVLGSGTSDLDWDHVETDADGKSVGFIDPGISFPAPFNDLFQSQNPFGSIVNGQFVSYSVDGIMVPKDYFAAMVDFAFGSQLGVVERQARLSQGRYLGSRYSYRDAFGQTHGTDRAGAITQAAEGNRTVVENRFWLVSDTSWAMNLSLLPQTQQQTLFPNHPSIEKRQLTKDEVAALRSRVEAMLDANDGKCKRYIEKLLDKTSELFPNGEDGNTIDVGSGLKTHLVLDVFDIVSEQGNFHFAYGNTVNMFRNKPEFNGARVWLGGNAGLDPQRRSSANLTAFQLSQAHVLDSLLTVTAIHELIHYNYNDNQLAYATAALKGERYTGTGFFGTSNYWGDELKRNCDPNWIEPKKK